MTGLCVRLLGALVFLGLSWGCSEVPPNLPSTQAYQRNAPRIELVELIVDDRERAEKVRSLYVQVEDLMLATQKSHVRRVARLATTAHQPFRPSEARKMFAAYSKIEREALETYIVLQMQLRASVTPEEFERLNALK